MGLKIYGSFVIELTGTSTNHLDRIFLYGEGRLIAYFMAPVTYLAKTHQDLEARFSINVQNMVIAAGHYSLKLILNDKGNFSHVCLFKAGKDGYDIVFTVAVDSIIENSNDTIKVKFIITKINVEQASALESTVH